MAKYNRDEFEYGSGPSRQEDRNVVDHGNGRVSTSSGAYNPNSASRGSEYDYKAPAGTNTQGVYNKIRVRQSNGGYTSYPGQGNKTTDLVYRGEKPQAMKLPYTGSTGNEHMQLSYSPYNTGNNGGSGGFVQKERYISSEGEPPAYQGRESYRSSEGEPPQLAYDKAAEYLAPRGGYGGYQTYDAGGGRSEAAPSARSSWGQLGGYGMQQITPTWNEGDRNAALRESSKLDPMTGKYDINGDGKTNADDVHLMQDSIDGKTPMDADRLAQMYGITQGDYLADKKAIENATGGHRDISYRLDDPTGYVQNIRDGAQGYNDTVQGIKDGTVGINDFDRSVVDPSVLAQGYDKNLSGYKDDYAQAQKLLEGFEDIDTSVVDPSILADKNRSAFDAYTQAVKAAEDKLNNQSAFSYDLNGDALYQQYREQAIKAARKNSENAMQQAAAMNGGYGSSYASAMAGQAYSEAMSDLDNILPELYGQAYNRYLNDRGRNDDLALASMSRAQNLLGTQLSAGANEFNAMVDANQMGYGRAVDNRDYRYQKTRDTIGDAKDLMGRNDTVNANNYGAQVDANNTTYDRNRDKRDFDYTVARDNIGDAQYGRGQTAAEEGNIYKAQTSANDQFNTLMQQDRDFWETVRRDGLDRAFNEWAQRNGMADSLYSAGRQELQDAYQRFLDDRQQQNYEKEFDLQKEQQDFNNAYQMSARTWDAANTAASAGDFSMLGQLTGQQELFDSLTRSEQGKQALDQAYKAAQVGDYSGLKALGINTEQLEIQDMLSNQSDRVTLANKIAAFRATYGYDPFDGSPSGGGYGGGASGGSGSGSGYSGGYSGYSGSGGGSGSSGSSGSGGSDYQPLTGAQKPIGSAAEKQKYKDLYGDDWEMIYYSVYSG